MKKPLSILLIYFISILIVSSQGLNFNWAKGFDGIGYIDMPIVYTDDSGFIYNCGHFYGGTIDFNPASGVNNSTSVGFDSYIVKLDSSGTYVWSRTIVGNTHIVISEIFVDHFGNVYTMGRFADTVDFDPGSGVSNLIGIDGDNFVLKLDSNGDFIWAKSFVGPGYSSSENSIFTDSLQNVYISGGFYGTVDFDPGPAINNLISNGNSDIYIAKLDISGNLIWVNQIGGAGDDRCSKMMLDNNGKVCITGDFLNVLDFDPGINVHNLNSVEGNSFIAKYNQNGNLLFANNFGSGTCNSMDLDSNGNIYLTGRFSGTADFDPGLGNNIITSNGMDIYILKLDSLSNLVWVKRIGGFWNNEGYLIDVDQIGNVYVSGIFTLFIDFDPGPGSYFLQPGGMDNPFLLKLDSEGEFVFANTLADFSVWGLNSFTINNQDLYFTSIYYDTTDFDPGPGEFLMFNNNQAGNCFISKFSPCIQTFDTISITSCYFQIAPSGNYTWTSSGTYTDLLYNSNGCDSVITVNLTILDNTFSYTTVSECSSFTSPSGNYTWNTSGIYFDTIPNVVGCDSIIEINLAINNTSSYLIESVCDSFISPSGNYVWYSTGIYYDTISNTAGCDSNIVVQLDVYSVISTIINEAACISYFFNGSDLNISGTYHDTIQSSGGCDSMIILNLTILESTNSIINVSECNSYISPSGNYIWNTSGLYFDTIPNAVGCDSIIEINLAINNTTSYLTELTCDSFISPSGNYVWNVSGVYLDTIPNTAGCDSVITVDLTIVNVDNSITQNGYYLFANEFGAIYQWIDCLNNNSIIPGETYQSFSTTTNGEFAVIITINGCTDTSLCYTITGIGIDEDKSDSDIRVYPNPANEIIYIDFGDNILNGKVELLNSIGQVLILKDIRNKHEQLFDVKSLSIGEYVVRVSIKDRPVFIEKIIIE